MLGMNVSPDLAPVVVSHGRDVVHWSHIGNPRATDVSTPAGAREHERVVVTHDLDIAAILAEAEVPGPAFYHWRGRQSLRLAVAVARHQAVDLEAIRQWSRAEERLDGYEEFLSELRRTG